MVNTNYCFVHIERQDRNVLVTSVIDNLLKGHPDRRRSEYEPDVRTGRNNGFWFESRYFNLFEYV